LYLGSKKCTHGGWAYGIPKNWDVVPEETPIKVPESNFTVGAARVHVKARNATDIFLLRILLTEG